MHHIALFIPTRGRGTDLRICHSLHVDQLAREKRLARICVCVVEEEAEQWRGHPLLALGVELYVLPPSTRLEVAKQTLLSEPGDVHVITDDDLSLFRRQPPHCKTQQCTYADILDLFSSIAYYTLTAGVAHGGISSLQCHNAALENTPDIVLTNVRCGGFHFFCPDVLRRAKVDYTRCLEAEDIDTQLVLLKLGIANVQLWNFAYQQTTNAKGGCSAYRTLQSVRAAAERLQRLHPDCVKLTEKYSKVWNGYVLSITAYYKRAYKSSGRGASTSSSPPDEKNDGDMQDLDEEGATAGGAQLYDHKTGEERARRRQRRRASISGADLLTSTSHHSSHRRRRGSRKPAGPE